KTARRLIFLMSALLSAARESVRIRTPVLIANKLPSCLTRPRPRPVRRARTTSPPPLRSPENSSVGCHVQSLAGQAPARAHSPSLGGTPLCFSARPVYRLYAHFDGHGRSRRPGCNPPTG